MQAASAAVVPASLKIKLPGDSAAEERLNVAQCSQIVDGIVDERFVFIFHRRTSPSPLLKKYGVK